MRPILLRFSGLQSYREPQAVDFDGLAGSGVFGIFGPTGSGKSTILDAITLALYGKVERAPGNTAGILNTAEDRLSVAFTFDLGTGVERRRYRVERSYVRADGDGLRSGHCRLVAAPGDVETVLADKERDVTRQVVAILGLEAEDFTRAVVLPQGKFAEFLTLKGSERRRMLQRLFGLEAYGDRLAQRLKERLETVNQRLQAITGEQRGLGDASAATVATARAAVAGAAAREAAAVTALTQLRGEYQARQRLREWQAELQRVEELVGELDAQRPTAAAAAAELTAAQRAEPLRALLAAAAAATQRQAAAAADHQQAQAALAEAEARAKAERQHHQAARARREAAVPDLHARRARLEEALRLADAAAGCRQQVDALAAGLAAARQERETTAGGMAELEAALVRLRAEDAQRRRRLAEIAVSPDRRRHIAVALSALTARQEATAALDQAVAQCRAAEERLGPLAADRDRTATAAAAAADQLRAAERAVAAVEPERPATDEDVTAGGRWLERAKARVDDVRRCHLQAGEAATRADAAQQERTLAAERLAAAQAEAARCAEHLAAATTAEAGARAALEAWRQRQAAAHLAVGLRPGEPCPVCGSVHHPRRATAADDTANGVQAVETAVAAATAALDDARQDRDRTQTELAGATAQYQHLQAVATEAEAGRIAAAAALTEARRQLPRAWGDVDPDGLPAEVAKAEQEYHRVQAELAAWRERVEAVRQQLEDVRVAERRAHEAAQAAATACAGAESAARWAQQAVAAAAATLRQRQVQLDAVRGDLAVTDIAAAAAGLAALDDEAAQLAVAAEDGRRQQDEAEGMLATVGTALRAAEQALAEREARWQAETERAADLERQIMAITGGGTPGELLQTLAAELQGLQADEDATRIAMEAADAEQNRCRQAAAATGAALGAAVAQSADVADRLAAGCREQGWPEPAAAGAALRTAAERAELDRFTQAFAARTQHVDQERRRLGDLLGERQVTAAEWEQAVAELEQAEAEHRQAVADAGGARQALEHLEHNHRRWTELEAERSRQVGHQAQLLELQGLLRGNAFVEFVAEEQLQRVAQAASARLGELTRYRYALEVDSGGGFVMRDDANGGARRPVHTLSGGETFLTSLALALALSAQVQLRGRHPLEFFFLDEGFGTLDPELLDVVVGALEKLQTERLQIGVISHVPELRTRLGRRLVVEPAEPGGRGSQVRLEAG